MLHFALFLEIELALNVHLLPFHEALPVPLVQVTLASYAAVVGKDVASSPFIVIANISSGFS